MVLPVVAGAQNTSRRAIPGSYDLGNVIDLINYLTGKDSDGYDAAKADMNGDGKVDVSDVVSMVNIAIRDSEMNADFGSPENARQYLVNLYHMQRFGLPHTGGGSYPKNTNSESSYTGHLDALTDCYQLHWYGASIYNNYYNGNLSADNSKHYNDPLISYNHDWVWETVSMAWRLIENINIIPDLQQAERDRMVAEAKCIIALRYFDLLPYYGGLPIVRNSESGKEPTCGKPRATFGETVDFMVSLLDEAIPAMSFARDDSRREADGYYRFWTAAGAMALKAKILMLAASPLFNNAQGYYGGTTEAEQQHLVWYGNYDAARWQRALQACKDFFDANEKNGNPYKLVTAAGTNVPDYRLAYRKGYLTMDSPEVLHVTRPYTNYSGGEYGKGGRETTVATGTSGAFGWLSWVALGRNAYNPTQEYVEMFPWSDGTPFDWKTAYDYVYNEDGTLKLTSTGTPNYSARSLNCMFKRGTESALSQFLLNVTLTRDPRLYENAAVNGIQKSLDWTVAAMSGNINELWVNGTDAGENITNGTSNYATGYGVMKYYLGNSGGNSYIAGDFLRMPIQYVILGYNEMLLMYAECLAQTGNLTDALTYVNQIRKRVGLSKGIESVVPEAKTDKDRLLEEILRERACELGMSGNRYFDLVRYMRGDWLTKQLHGLEIHRLTQTTSGTWVHLDQSWRENDRLTAKSKEPRFFDYKVFELWNVRRVLWGKDPSSPEVRRMFLWPFPAEEVDKGYGLVQNPGW